MNRPPANMRTTAHPAWLTERREPGDREIGEAFRLMGTLGLAGCLVGSLAALLVFGTAERPEPIPIDYVFRQRWTWINELSALFIVAFPATGVGVLIARRIADRRQLLPLAGSIPWPTLAAFGDRLAGAPVAGGVAGALLYAVVNPGPGLIGAAVRSPGSVQGGAIEGVGALILAGVSVGWAVGMLLTGAGLRRRAAAGAPRPDRPVEQVTGVNCVRIALTGVAGCAAGALVGWLLFGLAERPLELVRDPGPASREQWDWMNEGRHVLVAASVGLYAGLIGGRLLVERSLRAAGFEGLPFGPLRPLWPWLLAVPVACALAAILFYELQNPDRVFDMTLPIVSGVLAGLTLVLLVAGVRVLRRAPSGIAAMTNAN